MRTIFYILSLLLFSTLSAQPQNDYYRIFNGRYYQAEKYLKSHEKMFLQRCTQFHTDYLTAISVVFPELIRYNPEGDMIETMSNRVFYGNFGGGYGTFSTGCFQMKPVFIEEMESYILSHAAVLSEFRFIAEYPIAVEDEVEIRKARLSRMSKPEWQIVYLCCFLKIMNLRFPSQSQDTEEKIRFLATAYNRGFLCSEVEIKKWMKLSSFPDGINSARKQYNYGDVAWYAYRKLQK